MIRFLLSCLISVLGIFSSASLTVPPRVIPSRSSSLIPLSFSLISPLLSSLPRGPALSTHYYSPDSLPLVSLCLPEQFQAQVACRIFFLLRTTRRTCAYVHACPRSTSHKQLGVCQRVFGSNIHSRNILDTSSNEKILSIVFPINMLLKKIFWNLENTSRIKNI